VSLIVGDYFGNPEDLKAQLGYLPHKIEPVGLRTPDKMPTGYDPLGFARLMGRLTLTMPSTGLMMFGNSTTVDRNLVKAPPQEPIGHYRYAIKIPKEQLDEVIYHLEQKGEIRLIRY
jgi:hypothetical protein